MCVPNICAIIIIIINNTLRMSHLQNVYEKCKLLRETGTHHQAWATYLQAKEMDINNTISNRLALEASILTYYISSDRASGLRLCYDVLRTSDLEPHDYKCTHDNMMFYVSSISSISSIKECKPTIDDETTFSYTTPSFLDDNVMWRLVNYSINDHGGYIIRDPDSIVRTENLWEGRGILKLRSIAPHVPQQENMPVKGLEDIRLIRHNNNIYGLASSWEYSHVPRLVSQVLLQIDESSLSVDVLAVLSPGTRCEKNHVWGGFPYIIYDWYPRITVLKLDMYQGHPKVITHKTINSSELLRFHRGGSNGVLYNDQYWFITHSVIDGRRPIRHYLHYIVVLDKNLDELQKVSLPFTFEDNADIEFCTALRITEQGLETGYSIRDGTPRIRQMNWENVNTLFVD